MLTNLPKFDFNSGKINLKIQKKFTSYSRQNYYLNTMRLDSDFLMNSY